MLAGASPDRLSPEAVLALSHQMGNSAPLEMLSRQKQPAAREVLPLPGPLPDMEPAVLGEGGAELIPPVDFSALPPLELSAGPVMGGEA